MEVFHDVPSLPLLNKTGTCSYVDLVASEPSTTAPLLSGLWSPIDVEDGTDETKIVRDELQYVIRGKCVLEDRLTGKRYSGSAGSLIWLPAGSSTCLVKSKNLTVLFVEPSYRLPATRDSLEHTWTASLDRVLGRAMAIYVEQNPNSKTQYDEATKYLPGGNTRSVLYYSPFPLAIAAARDCFVESVDGEEYLDFVSEYSAALFGHSNADILEAIKSNINNGLNFGGPNRQEVELAKSLVDRFASVDKVRFTNSGTEANLMAVQVAMAFTGRKKVVVFANGYHGAFMTFATPDNPINAPYELVIGTYNDVRVTNALITEDTAAVIVEPMLGAGGMIPATKEFLHFLRSATTRAGALLIFDEIITSRLHIGGMQAHHEVSPDLTTLGKYLGGGFSFGAFGGRADIMTILEPGRQFHSGTYNNNTFSMAAGVAASKLLTAEKIAEANRLGDRLRDGINEISHQRVTRLFTATGFGSAVGIHYHGPLPVRLRDAFFFFLLQNKIYIGKRGFLSVNLAHEQSHVDRLLGVVEAFVKSVLES